MGFTRKALFIATFGLSGLVFKDNSKKKPAAKTATTAKVAKKTVRPKRQTKVTRPAARAARRRAPRARAPKPKAARTSVAPSAGADNGTVYELERLAGLHGSGVLTGDEFAAAKTKILGTSPPIRAADRGPSTFPAVEANVAAARDLSDLVVHDSRS
jgi:outer membrane biosynthesis protein TonB